MQHTLQDEPYAADTSGRYCIAAEERSTHFEAKSGGCMSQLGKDRGLSGYPRVSFFKNSP